MRALPLLLVAVLGCGTPPAETPDAGHGAAPTIGNLVLNPATVKANQATNVTATFTFNEPDRDLATATLQLVGPDAGVLATSSLSASGLNAQSSGTAGLIFQVAPPGVGRYEVRTWVTDAAQHESNKLTAPLDATN